MIVEFCPANGLWNLCIILGLRNLFFFKRLLGFAQSFLVWVVWVWVGLWGMPVDDQRFVNMKNVTLGMLTYVGVV